MSTDNFTALMALACAALTTVGYLLGKLRMSTFIGGIVAKSQQHEHVLISAGLHALMSMGLSKQEAKAKLEHGAYASTGHTLTLDTGK